MNHLARHLTDTGSHGGLPFNPGCPACREERLAGTLVRPPLVSMRAQAGLAAALLAATAASPAAAAPATAPANPPTVAPELDSDQEGAADPGPSAPEESDPSSTSGADTPLSNQPLTVAPPGADDSEGEEQGGVESPPPADGEEDGDAGPAAGRTPAGAGTRPADPAEGERGKEPREESAGRPTAKAGDPPKADHDRGPAGDVRKGTPRLGHGQSPAAAPAPTVQAPGSSPAAAPDVLASAASSSGAADPADSATSEAPADSATPDAPADSEASAGRVHVVRGGESLWSIARDLLGSRATNAEVARAVQRIWDVNAAAIGTGNPDLLMAGQTLRLP